MKASLKGILAAAAAVALAGGALAANPAADDARKAASAGSARGVSDPNLIVQSEFVQVTLETCGNISMGTLVGDPGDPNDNDREMLYGWPGSSTSGMTLRVDGEDFFTYSCPAPPTSGPSTVDGVNTTTWEFSGVRLTQIIRIVNGTSTGRADTMELTLVATNIDKVSHEVGLRAMYDTQIADNDGAPFQVPGLGVVQFEAEQLGNDIPQNWLCFDILEDPTLTTVGTLTGGGATRPDRVVYARWGHINDTGWDFTVEPQTSVTGDSAVGTYWNPITLAPGQSRSVVTYYGLGEVTIEPTGPMIAGITAPSSLGVVDCNLDPNPFVVSLFLQNPFAGEINRTDVTATIALPVGLRLAAGETATKNIGNIELGQSAQVSWRVYATGSVSGARQMTVTYDSAEDEPFALNRSVTIPAFYPLNYGAIESCLANWTFVQIIPGNGTPGVEVRGEPITGQGLEATLVTTEGVEEQPGRVYYGAYLSPFGLGTDTTGFLNPAPGSVMAVTWNVESTAADRRDNPVLRVRATAADASHTFESVYQGPFTPEGGSAATVPTAGTAKNLSVVFMAPDVTTDGNAADVNNPDGFNLPFDIYHTPGIGTAGTKVTLKSLVIDVLNPDLSAPAAVYSRNFATEGAGAFAQAGVNPITDKLPVSYSVDANGLGIRTQGAPQNGGSDISFGFFDTGETPLFTADSSRLYRVTAVLGSDSPTGSETPTARLRFLMQDSLAFATNVVLTGMGDAKAMPRTGQDATVTAFVAFPPEVNGEAVLGAFDVYRDSASQGDHAVYLRSLTIESVPSID